MDEDRDRNAVEPRPDEPAHGEEKQPEPVLQTIGRWSKDFRSLEDQVARVLDKRPEEGPETRALGSNTPGFRPDAAPPPPAESTFAPKAPPMAPRPAPKAPPHAGRPPAPSEELLVPKPPPMAVTAPPPVAPAPPPVAPAPPPAAEGSPMSEAAQRLAASVAAGAPRFTSFEFSINLTDLLATYWVRRMDVLSRDEEGNPRKDYLAVLQRAKAVHEADEGQDREILLESIRQVADDLDADKIPFFAPALKGPELRFVQAVHDLSLALIHYKMATRAENVADRLVMLTSTTGAQGCLTAALNRFGGVDVPEAIRNYVEMLELKLRLEEENCRHLLAGK